MKNVVSIKNTLVTSMLNDSVFSSSVVQFKKTDIDAEVKRKKSKKKKGTQR